MDSRQTVAIDILADSSSLKTPLVGSNTAGSQSLGSDCAPSLHSLRRLEPALSRVVPDFFPIRRDAPQSHGWYDLFIVIALAFMATMGAVTAAISRAQTVSETSLGKHDPTATSSLQVIAPVFRYERYDSDVQISFDWEPKVFTGPQDCLNVSAVFQRVNTQDLNALVNFSSTSSLASWVVGAFEQYPNQPLTRSIFATLQQRLSGVTLNYMGCGHYDTLASCGFDPYRMCTIVNDSFVPRGQEVFFRVGSTQFTSTTLSLACNRTVHSFFRGDAVLDQFMNMSAYAEHPSDDFVQCVLDRMETCVTSFNYTQICTDVFAKQDPPRFLNTYESHPSALQVIAQVSTIMGISYLGLKFVLSQIYWHWVVPKPSVSV